MSRFSRGSTSAVHLMCCRLLHGRDFAVTVAWRRARLDFSLDAARLEGKGFYQHVSRTVMVKIAEPRQVPNLGTDREAGPVRPP